MLNKIKLFTILLSNSRWTPARKSYLFVAKTLLSFHKYMNYLITRRTESFCNNIVTLPFCKMCIRLQWENTWNKIIKIPNLEMLTLRFLLDFNSKLNWNAILLFLPLSSFGQQIYIGLIKQTDLGLESCLLQTSSINF